MFIIPCHRPGRETQRQKLEIVACIVSLVKQGGMNVCTQLASFYTVWYLSLRNDATHSGCVFLTQINHDDSTQEAPRPFSEVFLDLSELTVGSVFTQNI